MSNAPSGITPELLTSKQAAELLAIGQRTLWRWSRSGRAWRAIEIDGTGWRLVDACPVRFRRGKAMQALPEPIPGGSIGDLRRFINATDDDWLLLLGWLAATLRPTGPYPVLALHGEQGSAKTTTARVLRAIVDPNAALVRCEPREPRDLMIAANNGWVVAFDNLSHVPSWLSDALCRLSTGGGFSTRTLYENDEETMTRQILRFLRTNADAKAVTADAKRTQTTSTQPPSRQGVGRLRTMRTQN